LLTEISLEETTEGLLLAFRLPAGSFATAVIDEIGKGRGEGWGLSATASQGEVQ
jgi:tRNA(Glu) U13 pseudouridine synthase TruD